MFVQSFVTAITLNPVLGAAAGGAVNTAVNGGSLGRNILLAEAGVAIGTAAGLAAGPLAGALGGGFWGGLASATLAAAAAGAAMAAIAGGNPLEGAVVSATAAAVMFAAVYGGAYAWNRIATSPAIGGKESCNNCQPPGVGPSGNIPAYSYNDLFEGGARITSPYGSRYIVGTGWEVHPGVDIQPRSGGYGTQVVAPGQIAIGYGEYLSGYGDTLNYVPEGTNIEVFHGHTKLLPGLEPGMVVNTGTPIGTITQTGRTYGPHSHIEIRQGGLRYDPSTIFK
jgi:murein DD-endopeptidase MepM/ murein hydrolase activator NlpD